MAWLAYEFYRNCITAATLKMAELEDKFAECYPKLQPLDWKQRAEWEKQRKAKRK